jgi:acyl-CoA synthetase (AMP-forming)/AMP-acid ligase II
VVDGDERYAYGLLRELVQRLAGALGACGVREEDVVSFQLPNWVEAAVVHQAAAMVGAVSNPIMPIYRSREVHYILRQYSTKILFIPYVFRGFDYLEMVRSLAEDVPTLETVVVVDKYLGKPALDAGEEPYPEFLASGPVVSEFRPFDESSVALLLYTSGITADPKGILHTHNTLLYESRSMIELHDLGADDGYFLTGDLAVIDDEGYFKIIGRKKAIIVRGGENISVKEVEDLLYGHPTVSEVAIFAMPDGRMGEKGCAYVVPKEGQTFSLDEIKEFLMGEGIARQKRPERLEVVDEMPTTASGKIQKYVLREEMRRKVEAYR